MGRHNTNIRLPWADGRLSLVWALGRGCRARFFASVFFAAAMVFFTFITPQIVRVTVDNILGDNPWDLPGLVVRWLEAAGGRALLRSQLWLCGAAAIAAAALAGVSNFYRRYFVLETAETLAKRLRDNMYKHVQTLPYNWHVKAQTGDIIQRATSDVETFRNFFADQLSEMIRAVMIMAVAGWVMFEMDPVMAVFSICLFPFVFLFSMFFYKAIARSFTKADEAEGVLQAQAQENYTGVRVVRAFGRERHEKEIFKQKNDRYTGLWIRIGNLLAFYWSFGDMICGLQMTIVLGAGIVRCADGLLTAGTFITFIAYAGMMIWPVRSLGRILTEMSKAGVSIGRIREVLAEEPESDAPDAKTPEIRGHIVFGDVTFGYEADKPVLRNVSFSVAPGQTLAVLGGTGSGKSTLCHLLTRLYDVPEGNGRITIDGTDIREISRAHIRRNVGLVLQEPFLFSRSLRDNIAAPEPEASLGMVRDAARVAHVHDAIEKFGEGYETVVGERGVTLSGGQKQRVAIARTVITEAPIMIFDDSLSAVDTETDARIRAALNHTTRDVTTIIVSHRTSTLMQADLILVLMDGRVAELGSHAELMAGGGAYRRMFDLQSDLAEEVGADA